MSISKDGKDVRNGFQKWTTMMTSEAACGLHTGARSHASFCFFELGGYFLLLFLSFSLVPYPQGHTTHLCFALPKSSQRFSSCRASAYDGFHSRIQIALSPSCIIMKWERDHRDRPSPYGHRTMRAVHDDQYYRQSGTCICCGRYGHIKVGRAVVSPRDYFLK